MKWSKRDMQKCAREEIMDIIDKGLELSKEIDFDRDFDYANTIMKERNRIAKLFGLGINRWGPPESNE